VEGRGRQILSSEFSAHTFVVSPLSDAKRRGRHALATNDASNALCIRQAEPELRLTTAARLAEVACDTRRRNKRFRLLSLSLSLSLSLCSLAG